MKAKNKKVIFVCQVNEQFLKAGKYLVESGKATKVLSFEKEIIPADAGLKLLIEKIKALFKKLGYVNDSVVVCLPRSQVTCRYIKIPSVIPFEVEKIACLQASRYLPYPSEELICSYQLIQVKDGYSEINLAIAHKNSVDKYADIFAHQAKNGKLSIVLSSYGLSNIFYSFNPAENEPVMLLDEGDGYAEIAVVWKGKLLYSRSFKFLKSLEGWQEILKDEINKTRDAFSREVPGITISRVETLSQLDAAMLGIAQENIPIELNLLPKELKDNSIAMALNKERVKVFLFVAGIIIIWMFGALKNFDNKVKYFACLKSELRLISNEARPLENIEKRFKFIEKGSVKAEGALEVLYELHKIVPSQVTFVSLDYEENKTVILRGLATELNSIITFVSELEKSQVFNKFKIRIDYATQKKLVSGEAVDFQITCQK